MHTYKNKQLDIHFIFIKRGTFDLSEFLTAHTKKEKKKQQTTCALKFNFLYCHGLKLKCQGCQNDSIQFELYASLSQDYGNNSETKKKNTNETILKSF